MTVEERLRDALATRAGTVAFDPHAYDAIVRRRARRRTTRWVAPVAALAATVTVAGGAVLASRSATTTDVTAVPGGQRHLIALRSFGSHSDGTYREDAAVLDANAISGPAAMQVDNDTYEVNAVSALGDGRTFYAAGRYRNVSTCQAALLRIDAEGGTVPLLTFDGLEPEVAVTRDGRRIAYSYGACANSNDATVVVRDLATGAERKWTTKLDEQRGGRLKHLAWSPDGHTLAFQTGLTTTTLDTTAPAGTFVLPEGNAFDLGNRPSGAACSAETPAFLPSGELVVSWRCVGGGVDERGVRAFDVARQMPGRELFRLPAHTDPEWLAVDPTGRYMLAGGRVPSQHGAPAFKVVYWNGKGKPKPVDTGDAQLRFVAW